MNERDRHGTVSDNDGEPEITHAPVASEGMPHMVRLKGPGQVLRAAALAARQRGRTRRLALPAEPGAGRKVRRLPPTRPAWGPSQAQVQPGEFLEKAGQRFEVIAGQSAILVVEEGVRRQWPRAGGRLPGRCVHHFRRTPEQTRPGMAPRRETQKARRGVRLSSWASGHVCRFVAVLPRLSNSSGGVPTTRVTSKDVGVPGPLSDAALEHPPQAMSRTIS